VEKGWEEEEIMAPFKPTKANIQLLKEIKYYREELNPPTSWVDLARKLNWESPEALRKHYSRCKEYIPDDSALTEEELGLDYFANIEFQDSRNGSGETVPWREILDHAKKGADLAEKLETTQEIANVNIDTKGPIAVCYTSDWHLGDIAVDYELWKKDIQIIMDTPNMYLITLGDLYENMRSFKHLATVLNQAISAKQQVKLLQGIATELSVKQKLLGAVEGNHDGEFDERIFGESLQEQVFSSSLAPRFKNKGVLSLHIGNETYDNLLFHKSRYRSILRGAHGAYREWEFIYPAEVVAGGHDHLPAIEVFWGYQMARDMGKNFGGETYLIKLGSYQNGDFRLKYFQRGFPILPTVIYYPDRHEKRIVFHPSQAVDLLRKENPNGI
jgi:hypothetical protein